MVLKKIKVSLETRAKLGKYGAIGMSYEDILKKILAHIDVCDDYWNSDEL